MICCAVFFILMIGPVAVSQSNSIKEVPNPQGTWKNKSAGPTDQNDGQIIVNTDLVALTVSVVDAHGRDVAGLVKDNFRITDNRMPQEISFFSRADLPVSIGVVFDILVR